MSRWIAVGFLALGLLHAPPAIGVLSADGLVALYGPGAGDTGVRLLLQHRGAVFALIMLGCFVAAAIPRWRPSVAILAAWSMTAFVGLYLAAGAPTGPLRTIAIADAFGIVVALWLGIALRRGVDRSGVLATR